VKSLTLSPRPTAKSRLGAPSHNKADATTLVSKTNRIRRDYLRRSARMAASSSATASGGMMGGPPTADMRSIAENN